ncbi:MAG: hypothetical protein IJ222_02960 [Bacteroidales bacterium]|nr:hypothetical protein [Bacteroidales bacterium]
MTLFDDELSLPIADIGPITPKQLLGDIDLGETLGELFEEDEDGYLVVETEDFIYSNPVLLVYIGLADPTRPSDVNVDDFTAAPDESLSSLSEIGLVPALQEFSLYAGNPLTEGIAFSGKISFPEGLVANTFSKETITERTDNRTFFQTSITDGKPIGNFTAEQMTLHLPSNILEKDPMGGWSSFTIGYRYKAYLALESDFPESVDIPIDNLDVPLGRYKVKEARIRTEVSNEIPLTLILDSVKVMVKEPDEEGNEQIVESEDVSVSSEITVISGSSDSPAVSPLEIVIKAGEGTIPDIAGLKLSLSVKAPVGGSDHRLNMNQAVTFNHIRATVYGGITL